MPDSHPPKTDQYVPFYQAYNKEEDTQRSQSHYEQPAEFFYHLLGGEWHVYSGDLWPPGTPDITAAQQAHLDLLARLMGLKAGQRILDVGCGWGGPLVYLCKTYGVSGVGLTVSPSQRVAATERIACYGVNAQIVESHWEDFTDPAGFDAVYSDEVIVHFNNLVGYFQKVHTLLHDGGRMVNKELHYTHPLHYQMTRSMSFVNDIFGETGNYRTLADELAMVYAANFEVQQVYNIDISNYLKTFDGWLGNMRAHRAVMEAAVGPDTYHRYRTYVNIIRQAFTKRKITLDVVVSHKISDPA